MKKEIPEYAIHNDTMISGFFGPYHFLSNFHEVPVAFMGQLYGSTEAAYQAAKCIRPEDRALFEHLKPFESKKLGKKIQIRLNWEDVKVSIMRYLVTQKFSSYKNLRELLVNTGNRSLVEANDWHDNYWGQHYEQTNGLWRKSGAGINKLGLILMGVRELFM